MKICIRCHQTKSLDEFSNYTRYADGKHRYCKVCHRANVTASRRRYGTKPQIILPVDVRFWSHVKQCEHEKPCPYCCWEWQKGRDEDGYGKFSIKAGQGIRAHRFAYFLWHGTMPPPEKDVCHTCDSPWCNNPLHLWLGTNIDNQQDCLEKGRRATKARGNHGSVTQPWAVVHGEKQHLAKLTENQVREIRMLRAEGISTPRLASIYNVSKQNILAIIHNRTWKHML